MRRTQEVQERRRPLSLSVQFLMAQEAEREQSLRDNRRTTLENMLQRTTRTRIVDNQIDPGNPQEARDLVRNRRRLSSDDSIGGPP